MDLVRLGSSNLTSANFAPRHQAYVMSIKLVWKVSTYSFTSISICIRVVHFLAASSIDDKKAVMFRTHLAVLHCGTNLPCHFR